MSAGSALRMKANRSGATAAKQARAAKNTKSAASHRHAPARKPSRPAKPAAPKKAAGANSGKRSPPAQAAVAAKPVARKIPVGGAKAVAREAEQRVEERYAGLTEADLLRAPSAQYMNPAQIAFFRERLRAMQRELLQKADVTSEHLREHDIEPDPTDQATIEEEYALELRARDRERKLLKKIEQALRRIEDGSYGYCEETGDAIGIARLLARPTATLSIEAQSRRELKQKLYGD